MSRLINSPLVPIQRPVHAAVVIFGIFWLTITPTWATETATRRADVEFDSQLLMQELGNKLDLRQFSKENSIIPGLYRADIYLNQRWLGRLDLRMVQRSVDSNAVPCLESSLIEKFNIQAKPPNTDKTQDITGASNTQQSCLFLADLVEEASAEFDSANQRLDISIPQALLKRQIRGAVPIDNLDPGVTAGILNYQFNTFHNSGSSWNGGSNTSHYLGLNAGLNIGMWRFRHQGSIQNSSQTGTQYQQISSYLSRDLLNIKSNLTLGQTFTDGQLFDSFAIEGVKLSSDERMLPESQRGFAPVIRSEARSNAKVAVTQNGLLIYETVVPPGPFVLNDLYPTGFGGDLIVTITEADGSQRSFNVPFSAMPSLMREGQLRYSLVLGKIRQSNTHRYAAQATAQFGFSNRITANAGFLLANQYASALGGVGLNTQAGAFVVNASLSSLNLSNRGRKHGASINASWSKLFEPTRTNFSFAAYRYNSENYYTLQDAVNLMDTENAYGQIGFANMRQRSLILGTVSQSIGQWGTLNFSGSSSTYWGQQHSNSGYQLGYSFNWGQAQINLNMGREYSMDPGIPVNNRISLGLTLPLEIMSSQSSSLTATAQHDSLYGVTSQIGAFGNFGSRTEGNYALTAARNYGQEQASATLGYKTPVAQIGGSISSGSGQSQYAVMASGGVILHQGGLTLTPTLGETTGLIYVEKGQGVQLAGFQGAPVDSSGYMVVPYLSPYTMNTVELDLSKAATDVQLDTTSQQTAPTAGAVVRLKFNRLLGQTLMIKSWLPNGDALPFGAAVLDEDGNRLGAVGQFSRLEARVNNPTGTLKVKWGDSVEQICHLSYSLPKNQYSAISQLKQACLPFESTQAIGPIEADMALPPLGDLANGE
jgi:outer membrane usher protein